eukprot:511338_1
MSSFNDINLKFATRSKITVDGYIREGKISSAMTKDIPEVVNHICLCFYYRNEYFLEELAGELMKVDVGMQTISVVADKKDTMNSAYLNSVIDSENGGKHCYKFKIINTVDDWFHSIDIGIWNTALTDSNKNIPINYSFLDETDLSPDLDAEADIQPNDDDSDSESSYEFNTPKFKSYSFDAKSASLYKPNRHYGKECVIGDIIDMCVDMDNLTIEYCINEKNYGIAFHITKGKYRVAVSMVGKTEVIQFLPK